MSRPTRKTAATPAPGTGIAYGAPVPGFEPIAKVPEPASVALFVLGMFGFGTLLCRRVR